MAVDTCVFCRIIRGDLPASAVYEDATVLAFMDINPVNPGHVLVVPKAHLANLADMAEATGEHLFTIAMRMAYALRRSDICCDAVNLFLADGAEAGQEVLHVHLHVIPRFRGDAFKIEADWSAPPPRQEIDDCADRLRRAYDTAGLPMQDG